MKYITLKKRKKTINATELTRRKETQMGTRLTSQNIDSTLHLQQMVTILSIFYTSHLLEQPNVYSFS